MKSLLIFIGILLLQSLQTLVCQVGDTKIPSDSTICLTHEDFGLIRKIENSQSYYYEAYKIHQSRIEGLEKENRYLYKIITTDSLITDSEGVKNQDLLSAVSIYQAEKQEASDALKMALKDTKKQKTRKQIWKFTTFVVATALTVETAILLLTIK